MGADAKLMEALLRIEHKLDLVLAESNLGHQREKVGSVNHTCPICASPVQYDVDIQDSVVVRKCKCGTGKVALDMRAFAPPALPAKKKEEEDGGSEQEDRGDTNRRGRTGWR